MSTSESVDLDPVTRCVGKYGSTENLGRSASACHSELLGRQVWIQSMADRGETESQTCLSGTDTCACHWDSGLQTMSTQS